jgi:hypothetical protein
MSPSLTLMMETEIVSKTLVFNVTLTWLNTQENFTAFIRRESFKSYTPCIYVIMKIVPEQLGYVCVWAEGNVAY